MLKHLHVWSSQYFFPPSGVGSRVHIFFIELTKSHAPFLRALFSYRKYWIVMDYCPGGALLSLLRQDGSLPEDSIRTLAKDIVEGLQAIHSQGLVVCQLVPSKILVDNSRLVISDLSRAVDISASQEETALYLASRDAQYVCDTHFKYLAPELLAKEPKPFTLVSDLWALGCILYEMCTGQHPFPSTSQQEYQVVSV
jgi:serine/threonine-protein kinase ULK4